ncbi:MAG: hypothetical protein ACLPT4_09925 [Verrucomicrobiia bacterium]
MNLKWLKQNVLTVGFLTAFVIVLGVLIWLQQAAASKRAGVDAALQEKQSQLGQLLLQKPAPSHESIDLIKQDREQVDQLYGQLVGAVSHKIEVPPDLRPVGFLQLMASSFSRLHQAAEAAGIKLQDGFAFGFGRYAGSTSTLPAKNLSPEDTKRVLTLLVKQLAAIDQISTLLISNHVAEIVQIRRAEVEPGGGGGGSGGSGAGGEPLDASIKTDPKALYQVLPFEFQFRCSGEALRGVLNSLTKADLFLAVRRLQITGEAPVTEKTSTGSGAAAAAVAAAATPTILKPTLLTVTMRIDLIEFPTPQPAKKEAGKPGA